MIDNIYLKQIIQCVLLRENACGFWDQLTIIIVWSLLETDLIHSRRKCNSPWTALNEIIWMLCS